MQLIKKEIKKTFELAYPVIIGQLGFIMMGVVDSIMVGSVGAVPLAAASVGNSLFILISIVGLGISISVTPCFRFFAALRMTSDKNYKS